MAPPPLAVNGEVLELADRRDLGTQDQGRWVPSLGPKGLGQGVGTGGSRSPVGVHWTQTPVYGSTAIGPRTQVCNQLCKKEPRTMFGSHETDVTREFLAFLFDRRARGLSEATIDWYQRELELFGRYLEAQGVQNFSKITPKLLREYFLDLGNRRNPGGVFSMYRAIRAFFNWYTDELEDPAWKNPMRKVQVKAPEYEPLPGIPVENVLKMVETCGKTFYGRRDAAILLFLVDTGARRGEFLALNMGDIDLRTGQVQILYGKGGKRRVTFMGVRVIRAITRYLRVRSGEKLPECPLWVSRYKRRLGIKGLEQIIRTRAERAGIPIPGVHDFRRTFALESLRNGIDVYSLMRLMGHTSPQVLNQYLALVDEDLKRAHETSSPIDNFSK